MQSEIIYFFIGGVIGSIISWFITSIKAKHNNIPKSNYDLLTSKFNLVNIELGIEKEKVRSLTNNCENIEADLRKQLLENSSNTKALATTANENLNLKNQLSEIQKLFAESNIGILNKQNEIQTLEKSLTRIEVLFGDSNKSIEQQKVIVQELRMNLKNEIDKFNDANKKVTELNAKHDSLNEKLSLHKEAFLTLESDLAQHKTKLDVSTNAYSELNKKTENLIGKNEFLNEKLSDQKKLVVALESELSEYKTNFNSKVNLLNESNKKVVELTTINSSLNEKLSTQKEEIIEIQKTAHLQFEKIANQILDEKSDKFTETNKINIQALLKPLGENIEKFKTKVEETYDKESKQRFSLEERVKELIEQTNIVSSEANNLATALKGQAKKQGNWGEIILESILQKSGLVRDREYFIQKNIKDDEGKNLRPDVLISLPDNRTIIIDSKVSLVAYDRFSSTDKLDEQSVFLAEHLKSIYGHINDLQGKNYDNLEASLDFTMMFIPIEPAYLIAIQGDQELWAYAYSRRILLISPTNLIACLKLIADLWKREIQSKNAMEIVKRGDLLYDKFVLFVESIEDIGKQINRAQASYNTAVGQLTTGSGNLVGQALKLKSLGLKSTKEFSPAMQPIDFEPEIVIDQNLLDTNNAN